MYFNRDIVKEIPIFHRNPHNVNRSLLFLTLLALGWANNGFEGIG
jgi:hypothetical protein